MKKHVLSSMTALGVAVGGIGVASAQNMGQQNGYASRGGGASALTTPTTSSNQLRGPITRGVVPNPWDGTGTWAQWNKDHPMTRD